MSDGDKRKVSTDALETLGMIIDDTQKRDAIHLAVVPVRAKRELRPGQDVGANGDLYDTVGIVDPFLKENVKAGQWFWLVIYPRQINSLRHVWTHPAFEDEKTSIDIPDGFSDKDYFILDGHREAARKWIEGYAKDVLSSEDLFEVGDGRQVSFDELIEGAKNYLEQDKPFWVPADQTWYPSAEDDHDNDKEFWKNFEIYTGIPVPEEKKIYFFRCAC